MEGERDGEREIEKEIEMGGGGGMILTACYL